MSASIPFREDTPQSNSPPGIVPPPDHGGWLETRYCKGGIPTAPPLRLASQVHKLPPILYMQYQAPVPNWSKAPWGLSVLARVTSIFTGTSISPGASLSRQRSNHYAFRAGPELTRQKNFRYLRTVIVTAAVYWGLGFKLRLRYLSSNLPAPGRRQPMPSPYGFIDLCFAKQLLDPILLRPTCVTPFSQLQGSFAGVPVTMLLPPAFDSLLIHLCRFTVRAHGKQ